MSGYWNDGMARKKIALGGWDWVVINEIVYSLGGNTAKFQEFARKFAGETSKVNAKLLIFSTGEIESARPKTELMYRDAVAMAKESKCRVAGAGMAWLKAWAQTPALDLHFTDRAHPNFSGYYLNACVIYAALTDLSPVGRDACGLAPKDAAFFQRLAWEQYHDDRALDDGGVGSNGSPAR